MLSSLVMIIKSLILLIMKYFLIEKKMNMDSLIISIQMLNHRKLINIKNGLYLK